jgi:hypothetical protein
MNDRRKTDAEAYRKYRRNRFIKENGYWYFITREATTEGPFLSKSEAEYKLESYIRVINSVFMPRDRQLSLQSLDALELPESTPLH